MRIIACFAPNKKVINRGGQHLVLSLFIRNKRFLTICFRYRKSYTCHLESFLSLLLKLKINIPNWSLTPIFKLLRYSCMIRWNLNHLKQAVLTATKDFLWNSSMFKTQSTFIVKCNKIHIFIDHVLKKVIPSSVIVIWYNSYQELDQK